MLEDLRNNLEKVYTKKRMYLKFYISGPPDWPMWTYLIG